MDSVHKGEKMTDLAIPYRTGRARTGIEQALVAAGKDLTDLRAEDLALLEDFHTGGRLATVQLADLVGLTETSAVLDAGAGIGGTARYLAARFGCAVTAVDLSGEYCEIADWLDHVVGLEDKIAVRQADVTALPFDDASFHAVFSQHVQMNVADKGRLYGEARRVLSSGGQLALWDITAGGGGELDYPMPWADGPGHTHLSTPAELRDALEAAGFTVEHWVDLTEQIGPVMRTIQSLPPSPLGLQAFVPDFRRRLENLTAALGDGRLRAIQAIARAR